MSRPIFVDTGALLALEDSSDDHHHSALQFRDQELRGGSYDLITTSYVVDETLTLIRRHIGIDASIDVCQKLRRSHALRRIVVTREIEEQAMDVFETYDDKAFSFTDCVSFVVMREWGIADVFTFDAHFVQAGMGFIRRP